MMKLRAQLIAAFLVLAAAQTADVASTPEQASKDDLYSGLVMGIGSGTLAVTIFALLSMVICLLRDCSSTPNLLVFLAVCLPLLVLLIIVLLPKQSAESQAVDTTPHDNYMLYKLLITIGIGLFMIALTCVYLGSRLSIEVIAQRASSSDAQDSAKPSNDIEKQATKAAGENKPLVK